MSSLPNHAAANTTQNNGQTKSPGNNASTKLTAATTPNGSASSAAPSFVRKQNAKEKERERAERVKIVLWRQPIQTLKYCVYELVILMQTYRKK